MKYQLFFFKFYQTTLLKTAGIDYLFFYIFQVKLFLLYNIANEKHDAPTHTKRYVIIPLYAAQCLHSLRLHMELTSFSVLSIFHRPFCIL